MAAGAGGPTVPQGAWPGRGGDAPCCRSGRSFRPDRGLGLPDNRPAPANSGPALAGKFGPFGPCDSQRTGRNAAAPGRQWSGGCWVGWNRLAGQDGVDEGGGVEGGQVVAALAQADQLDRNAELTLDRDD